METTPTIADAGSPAEAQPGDLPELTPAELQVATALTADGGSRPEHLAAELKIETSLFLSIARRPAVKQWIEAATEVEEFRTELLARRAKADAIETLAKITRDTDAEPIERRRAATAILRALRPPPARRPAGDAPAPTKPHGAPPPAPEPPPARPPEPQPDPEAEARARLEQQRENWKSDAADLRRRFDFKTGPAAAESVAKILTSADPNDPEAALECLFLVTWSTRNFEDPAKFVHYTRYLTAAARGTVTLLKHVKQESYFAGYHLIIEPRSGAPLDLLLWIAEPWRRDQQASLVSVMPWNNGAALKTSPGNAKTIALDKVAPHLTPPPDPDPEPP